MKLVVRLKGKESIPTFSVIRYLEVLSNNIYKTSLLTAIAGIWISETNPNLRIESGSIAILPREEIEYSEKKKHSDFDRFENVEKMKNPLGFWELFRRASRPKIFINKNDKWQPITSITDSYMEIDGLKIHSPAWVDIATVIVPSLSLFLQTWTFAHDLRKEKQREAEDRLRNDRYFENRVDKWTQIGQLALIANDRRLDPIMQDILKHELNLIVQKQLEAERKFLISPVEIDFREDERRDDFENLR